MNTRVFKIKLLLTLLLLCVIQIASADNKDNVSLEQASETIRKESKGKVISATTSLYNGVQSHRIKVLTKSGRVKIYHVPVSKKGSSNNINNRYSQPNESNNTVNYRNQTSDKRSAKPKASKTNPSQVRSSYNSNNFNRNKPNLNNSKTSKKSSYSNGETKKQ